MKTILHLLIAVFLVASCSNSNHVSSNRLVQKRKFNKGWHWSGSRTLKSRKITQNSEVADTKEKNKPSSVESYGVRKQKSPTETTILEHEEVAKEFRLSPSVSKERLFDGGQADEIQKREVSEDTTEIEEIEEASTPQKSNRISYGIILLFIGILMSVVALALSPFLAVIGVLLIILGLVLIITGAIYRKKDKRKSTKGKEGKKKEKKSKALAVGLITIGFLGLFSSAVLTLLSLYEGVFWLPGSALLLSAALIIVGFRLGKQLKTENISKERRRSLITFLTIAIIFLVLINLATLALLAL